MLERTFEQPFPGYLAFQYTIGGLNLLSPSWVDALRRAKGVYLLSCPATGPALHRLGNRGRGLLGPLAGILLDRARRQSGAAG